MAGLLHGKFITPGEMKTPYLIIIVGENFGCGSSREHANCSGSPGVKVVAASMAARIFFPKCAATGGIEIPGESVERLCQQFKTGQEALIDFEQKIISNHYKRIRSQAYWRSSGIDAGGHLAHDCGMISR